MAIERLSRYGDWPAVAFDPAKRSFIVTGRYELPGQFALWGGVYAVAAIWALMLLSGGPISLLTLFLYMVTGVEGAWTPADNPRGWLSLLLIAGSIYLYRPLFRPFITGLLGGRVWVEVGEQEVIVGRGKRKVSVPRVRELEVAREQHRKATEEARRQGTIAKRLPVIYQDAFEVVIWYGVQRIVVAEMVWKEEDKALALALRLQGLIHDYNKILPPTHKKAKPVEPVAPADPDSLDLPPPPSGGKKKPREYR